MSRESSDNNKIVGEATIIRNVHKEISHGRNEKQNTKSSPILPNGNDHHHAFYEESSRTGKFTIDPEVRTSSRGTMMILPRNFLPIPKFRIIDRSENEEKVSFTVIFNRRNEKLGITIQEINSLIEIVTIHRSANSHILLAEAVGVRVGDIMTGINDEFFGPWAELKDVMD